MSENKKTFPGSGKFDPINSTYRQEIYFKTGKQISGYSKGLLIPEIEDKIVCLEKFILRMYNYDYLNPLRVQKIEYYRQSTLLRERNLVLTLYPTSYEFGEDAMYLTNERLNKFLRDLYKIIKEGTGINKILVHKPANKSEEDIFPMKYMKFKTEGELLEHILKLSKSGHAPGELQNYYVKYKQKFKIQL